jgi:protein O-GlcNAc transferase
MTSPLADQARQHLAAGRHANAFDLLATAPSLDDDLEAMQMLAAIALHAGQGARALERIEAAIGRRPGIAKLHALAAAVAQATGDPERASHHAAEALTIYPGEEIAAAMIVGLLADRFEVSSALRVAEACLERTPDAWGVRLARVFAWMSAGEAQRAMDDAESARAAAPHSLPARQNVAMTSLYLDEAATQTLERHVSVAREIPVLPGKRMATRAPGAGRTRPLRVGFVSPDLRLHPVGRLMAPLLRNLDRGRIHAYAYSDATPDAHGQLLRAECAHWRESREWTDAALFDAIQRDGIDVAIDLAGYSSGGRPSVFATRCAPVQLGYLGYLHPTGLATMDGLIGDAHTLPQALPLPEHEAPRRLPGHLFCFEPDAEAPEVATRGDGPIRFGSFNHLAKLSPATVRLWARLLDAVPDATLTLCAMALSDEGVRNAVWMRFRAEGVDPARILMLPPELDTSRFLARYADIDVALDPLPFNGGMTSLQALWQGVPVLTLPGERMAARMGASLMRTAGLGEFVAADEDAFVARGVRLAGDIDRLAALRAGMRDRLQAHGLLDGARFAAGFAALLHEAAAKANA